MKTSNNNQGKWIEVAVASLVLLVLIVLYFTIPPIPLIKDIILGGIISFFVLYLLGIFYNSIKIIFSKIIFSSKIFRLKQLYTLVAGIKDIRKDIIKDIRNDSLIQNFKIGRRNANENSNAVYHMWADNYKKSQINASIIDNEDCSLKVLFKNSFDSWPCNIAIIPFGFKAIENNPVKQYLVFEAKVLDIPQEYIDYLCKSEGVSKLEEIKISKLDNIGVSVRIVDGELQHWHYSHSPTRRKQFPIAQKKDWQKCYVDLQTDAEKNWQLFGSDGNYLYGSKKPNFSIISLVVLEFGSHSDLGILHEGIGEIGIKEIRLTNQKPAAGDLFFN